MSLQFKFVSSLHLHQGVFINISINALDTYHVAFPKDRLYIKCLVYVVFALELTQSILIMHDAYITYVARFGDFESVLQKGTFYWFVIPMFSGIGMFTFDFSMMKLNNEVLSGLLGSNLIFISYLHALPVEVVILDHSFCELIFRVLCES